MFHDVEMEIEGLPKDVNRYAKYDVWREDLTTYEGTTLREHLGVPFQYGYENNQ